MNIFIATKPLHDTNQTIVSQRVEFSGEEIERDFQDTDMAFAFKTSTYLRTIANRQEVLADTIHFLMSRFVLMNFLDISEVNIFVNSSKFDLYFNSNISFILLSINSIERLSPISASYFIYLLANFSNPFFWN